MGRSKFFTWEFPDVKAKEVIYLLKCPCGKAMQGKPPDTLNLNEESKCAMNKIVADTNKNTSTQTFLLSQIRKLPPRQVFSMGIRQRHCSGLYKEKNIESEIRSL